MNKTFILISFFLSLIACKTPLQDDPPITYDPDLHYKFYFGDGKKDGFEKITSNNRYGGNSLYGYDLKFPVVDGHPYFFSVSLPEGNYTVTVKLGNNDMATHTTIWSESRRLMLESVDTDAGKFVARSFSVNTRTVKVAESESVIIKPREEGKLNWDDKLTIEVNGERPGLVEMVIKKVAIPTLFLAGNSTVTDQDFEPWWYGWGQLLPRFLSPSIAVANYAESGESASTFVEAKRFAKILTQMKQGDYLMLEFGHNDQKQTGDNVGPYGNYQQSLRYMIDETRKKGATPILVTPIHRRNFDDNSAIVNTLGEYPEAMRQLARETNVTLIDLNAMSKTMFETWGPEISKSAFGHYPVGTFPGQTSEIKDNTHFNCFGAYELTKSVLHGLVAINSPLRYYVIDDFRNYDPSHPNSPDDFHLKPSMLDKSLDSY